MLNLHIIWHFFGVDLLENATFAFVQIFQLFKDIIYNI